MTIHTIDIEEEEMEWFQALLANFSNRSGFLKANQYKNLNEIILKCMKVGDIIAGECLREAPCYDIRHTLSYLVNPLIEDDTTITPSWRLLGREGNDGSYFSNWCGDLYTGNTVNFGSSCFKNGFFDEAIGDIPEWMVQMYKGTLEDTTEENIIKLVSNDK